MDTIIILLIGAALAFSAAGLVNGDRRFNGLAALAAIAAAALWGYGTLLPEGKAPPPETATLQPVKPKPAEIATPKPPEKIEPEPPPAPKSASKKYIYDRVGESGEIPAE